MRTTYRRRPSTIMPSSPVCPRPFWGVWQMADLDGDETRHKILFCDGMLTISRSVSSDHRSPPTAWASTQRRPQRCAAEQATKLFEHILAFLKEHLETGVCLLEASENGKQVIECFEELEQDGCEILRHMKVYGDWDSVLYELRLMTRAISATPRFCEMYYIWGSQDSGNQGEDVDAFSVTARTTPGWPGPVKSPSTSRWRMTSSSPFVTWKVRQSAAGSSTRVPGTSCLRLCWWQQAITLPV